MNYITVSQSIEQRFGNSDYYVKEFAWWFLYAKRFPNRFRPKSAILRYNRYCRLITNS